MADPYESKAVKRVELTTVPHNRHTRGSGYPDVLMSS